MPGHLSASLSSKVHQHSAPPFCLAKGGAHEHLLQNSVQTMNVDCVGVEAELGYATYIIRT